MVLVKIDVLILNFVNTWTLNFDNLGLLNRLDYSNFFHFSLNLSNLLCEFQNTVFVLRIRKVIPAFLILQKLTTILLIFAALMVFINEQLLLLFDVELL